MGGGGVRRYDLVRFSFSFFFFCWIHLLLFFFFLPPFHSASLQKILVGNAAHPATPPKTTRFISRSHTHICNIHTYIFHPSARPHAHPQPSILHTFTHSSKPTHPLIPPSFFRFRPLNQGYRGRGPRPHVKTDQKWRLTAAAAAAASQKHMWPGAAGPAPNPQS